MKRYDVQYETICFIPKYHHITKEHQLKDLLLVHTRTTAKHYVKR
jgi:hypothetical protein